MQSITIMKAGPYELISSGNGLAYELINHGLSWKPEPIDDWTRGLAALLSDMRPAPGLDYGQGIVQ